MYLVIIHYKKSLDVVDHYLASHRAYLEEGYRKEYLIVSGPKIPRTGGVLLSQLKDQQVLLDFLHQDPFYLHDVADFEIIEFAPVKYHKEFTKFI